MATPSQTISVIEGSTASRLDIIRRNRTGQPEDDTAHSDNEVQPGDTAEFAEEKKIKQQLHPLLDQCPTCKLDWEKHWYFILESCRLGTDGTIYIPMKEPLEGAQNPVKKCHGWVATWVCSGDGSRCDRTIAPDSLFCAVHKHAIEDHHIPTRYELFDE